MQVVHTDLSQWHTLKRGCYVHLQICINLITLFPTATAISRSERSVGSTPTSTLQTTINSTLCGDVRLLLQQQGKDGRDGHDGSQGPAGPQGLAGNLGPAGYPGIKGEKGDPGIQLQGPAGPQGT